MNRIQYSFESLREATDSKSHCEEEPTKQSHYPGVTARSPRRSSLITRKLKETTSLRSRRHKHRGLHCPILQARVGNL